ncbi:hypothetical protein ACLRGF_15045 [Mycetocola zhadangensis]|uniref:hypothetical protein n=1 Tax=Mycetocola zhadangensis TaxID=1164595 RepID=UPI003A4D494E
MSPNFLARMRPRLPRAVSHGQDESYSPAAEGCDLLGTGVDHLRAYLTLHPARLEALRALCVPITDHLRGRLDRSPSESSCGVFPHTLAAVADGQPEVWEGMLRDLLDATAGGPGLTVTPLVVLMSRAISGVLYDSEDNGLLFASSEARAAAQELLEDLPELMPVITEMVLLSRDAIVLRAARVGLDSVLLHRRVPTVSREDIFRLHQLGPLSGKQLADPEISDFVRSTVTFRTLSVWASDLPVARNWPLGADPGTQSAMVLSIRVPVTSLWLAPRSNDREFLISPEAIQLEHVEVLHRV